LSKAKLASSSHSLVQKPIKEMPESYESEPPISKFLGYNDYKEEEGRGSNADY